LKRRLENSGRWSRSFYQKICGVSQHHLTLRNYSAPSHPSTLRLCSANRTPGNFSPGSPTRLRELTKADPQSDLALTTGEHLPARFNPTTSPFFPDVPSDTTLSDRQPQSTESVQPRANRSVVDIIQVLPSPHSANWPTILCFLPSARWRRTMMISPLSLGVTTNRVLLDGWIFPHLTRAGSPRKLKQFIHSFTHHFTSHECRSRKFARGQDRFCELPRKLNE
jgi:hypothetical protein